MNLKIFDKSILEKRTASIDVYRGIAILLVVLHHFAQLLNEDIVSIGFIGVDLFFVISGYLVSKVLLKEIKNNIKVNWRSFIVKRVTKILPSYYFYIIVGTVLARIILLESDSDQVIPLKELPRYLFFYLNYDLTFSWSFENSWSLCVEEHFYLFLILFFILISSISIITKKKELLKASLLVFILTSIVFKIIGHFYGWNTFTASHMRMDALFLGVLLSFQEINEKIIKRNSITYTLLGITLLLGAIVIYYMTIDNSLFRDSLFRAIVPISFYFILRGTLFGKFKFFGNLRVLAYYSYNWYLWHSFIGFIIMNKFNLSLSIAFPLYLISTFVIAVMVTKFIEEPFINLRSIFIKKK